VTRTRRLREPSTDKAFATICDQDVVEVLSGLPGRERRREQAHVSPEQAVASARKQEWEHLKKGFY